MLYWDVIVKKCLRRLGRMALPFSPNDAAVWPISRCRSARMAVLCIVFVAEKGWVELALLLLVVLFGVARGGY